MFRALAPVTAIGVGLLAVTLASQGCSSSSSGTTSGGSGGGLEPPAAPAGAAPAALGTPRTFALQGLFLGGTDRTGAPSDGAWKKYGYDLDKKTTTSKSTDVCSLADGAPKSAQTDGDQGIDNSFGETILPIVTSVSATAETDINKSLTDGSFTVMLDIQGLTDDPAQTNTNLSGQIFAGATYSADKTAPGFDLTTDWPVRPELLADGKTVEGGSKVKFDPATTYIVKGQFVTQASAIKLSLAVGGQALELDILNAVITFNHTDPHSAATGTIAGIINTQQLVDAIHGVAGRLQKSLCEGSAFDQIATELKQASDIVSAGANNAGVPCDGISIGLGFTAKEIKHPTKVAPATVAGEDPCKAQPDAGSTTDAGSTDQ
jgi:hypothetical protein